MIEYVIQMFVWEYQIHWYNYKNSLNLTGTIKVLSSIRKVIYIDRYTVYTRFQEVSRAFYSFFKSVLYVKNIHS